MIRLIPSILILGSAWCHAAIVPQLTLDQLVTGSECIIEGHVLRSWSAWDQPHHFIWTHTEVRVRDRWKSSPSSANETVVLSEPGGAVRGQIMAGGGHSCLSHGRRRGAFSLPHTGGVFAAMGNGQGKFTITQAGGSHEERVRSNPAGLELIRGGHELTGPRAAFTETNGMRLDEFRRTVLSLLARNAAQ
jgi:hypothetical protein